MEIKQPDYRGFEITYYTSCGDTIIDRNGWSVKGIFFQGKAGLQLAKNYIDKLYEKWGEQTMKIPVYKLQDADGAF